VTATPTRTTMKQLCCYSQVWLQHKSNLTRRRIQWQWRRRKHNNWHWISCSRRQWKTGRKFI